MADVAPMWPFGPSPTARDAERLLTLVTAMGRRPGFFGEGRTPDTLEGRFEVMALHACLAFIRLRGEAPCALLAQAFADALFKHFDAGLREAGVGDLSVPRRMRRLAASFYGRLEVYAAAISARDADALAAALARNALGAASPFAAPLAAYVLDVAAAQAEHPPEALFSPEVWGRAPD